MSAYSSLGPGPPDRALPLPPGTQLMGAGSWLRTQLIGLMETIEAHYPVLHAALWLIGSDGQRYSIRDHPVLGTSHPCCSTALRGNTGKLQGALTLFVEGECGPDDTERAFVESVAWVAGLVVENASAGEYRALLDRVPAIMYIADPGMHGRWHYVNAKIEGILGFTAEEWSLDPLLWARQLHPDDRERVLAGESTNELHGVLDPLASEYRMLHRDGRTVWVRDDALLVGDDVGRRRWHGILLDITDRKLAELELERRAAQQAAVARLGEHALERAAIGELLEEAVIAARELLDVDAALVAELLPDRKTFRFRAASGTRLQDGGDAVLDGTRAQAMRTVLTGAPVVVSDWTREDRFPWSEQLAEFGVASSVSVPITGVDGPFGVVGVHSTVQRTYAAGDIDFIQSLANVLADAIERRSTEDAIEHRALHDPLTGLPNRVLFLDRLQHALERMRRRPGARAAVLFIDLDNFKLVNDSLGHHAGDELLGAVAARLKQVVRPTDTVARFGGDEFGLLLEEISDEREAVAMAERIGSVFARPFPLAHNEHFVTTSVGIALAQGGDLPQDLIRDADAAMYRAKERGRARYELFDEVMRGRAIARLRIENDLRRAIERDELRLAYQPIVSLRDESIASVEALLRWDHPERGPIPPSEFVPVAEESGLIERIGCWVLERACRQASEWAQLRPDARPIGIAVNLSPLQLLHEKFPEIVSEVLNRSGLEPSSLSLEITETLLLGESRSISEALRQLKAIGVRLVLDDFGTGYSSLSYLTRLPLDALKVDRAFVALLGGESSDRAITEAIIAMARALSLTVVGEGAETPCQVAALRRLGCELVQGYVFSPPRSAGEISALLCDAARLRQLT
ncbi:MAG: EAL domain-containing protein [Solirubrobacteraceae bacterium]